MRRVMMGVAIAAPAVILASAPGVAQIAMLNGKATNIADSNTGRLLRIVSVNPGGVRVSVRTEPSIALVCDARTPASTCTAWVRAGSKVTVILRRPPDARAVPGAGAAPHRTQWRGDCAGTTAVDCVVTMDADRVVQVDWAG